MTLATVSISSNTSIIGIALGVMLSLCVPTASAQRDQLIEKNVKASKTTFEDAMSMCNGDTRVLQELTGSGSTPLTRKFKVTSWNGECLNGKRHGKGTIDVTKETENTTQFGPIFSLTTETYSGQFAMGRRLGLWCLINRNSSISSPGSSPFAKKINDRNEELSRSSKTGIGRCTLENGDFDANIVEFRRLPDGRWQPDGDSATYIANEELELQSAKLIASGTANKGVAEVELSLVDPDFGDLTKGGQVKLAIGSAKASLKGKRVALILSTSAIAEMQKLRSDRELIISTGKNLSGQDAESLKAFAAHSDPDIFLAKLVHEIKSLAQHVVPVDDLTSLHQGRFDYALIINFKFLSRLDLLNNYGSLGVGETVTGLKLKAYLLSPDLKAIRLINITQNNLKRLNQDSNSHYLVMLAAHFENLNSIGGNSRPIISPYLKDWASQ